MFQNQNPGKFIEIWRIRKGLFKTDPDLDAVGTFVSTDKRERRTNMPLLPLYSFEIMQRELMALCKILGALKDKIPEDDFKKMDEHIEKIDKEIRSARF